MNWDEYFMGLAHSVAGKSKDRSTQVGAVIVDADKRLVSVGYNGAPRGINDDRVQADRDTKLHCTLHAEENAVLFAAGNVRGCSIYVTHHPCAHCAAVLVQSGIVEVVYPPTSAGFTTRWRESIELAQRMFREAGVTRRVVL